MAIEKATNELKNQNPSGLDRRLLLPSVEAKESAEQADSQTTQGGLFKSLNNLAVTISDKSDLIIDQLVDLNETMLKIEAKEVGSGGAENVLQTIGKFPGRAVRKAGAMAAGAGRMLWDYNPVIHSPIQIRH